MTMTILTPITTAFSPAKLNLFLHIVGKRDDGYHNLQTVFYALNFGDELTFFTNHHKTNHTPALILTGANHLTDDINDNLIVKAANKLTKLAIEHGKTDHLFDIKIHLTKKIPTGAGLGGGSSNAATTLLTLNKLWQLHYNTSTLINIAKSLGADVPFFMVANQHNAYIGEGIGEILTPINLPTLSFLLLFPNAHNNTANIFKHADLIKDYQQFSHNDLIAKQADYLCKLNHPFYNAFEKIACNNPNIAQALTYLNHLPTTAKPRLTGTGSTVFLPVDDLQMAAQWLKDAPCQGTICTAYNNFYPNSNNIIH